MERTGSTSEYDAVIVGSGPNGLAAAITLARAGCSVLLLEAARTVGGGLRSAELTLPGFVHDACASVLPLAAASPFFRQLPLTEHGLRWATPKTPLAHALEPGKAVSLERSLEETASGLAGDGERYLRLMRPLVRNQDRLLEDLLGPIRMPRAPFAAARFAIPALMPATLAAKYFRTPAAGGLFAGMAAHSMLPLERAGSASVALVLAMLAHTTGWPFASGGSAGLAAALESYLRSLSGKVETGSFISSVDELPPARMLLLDVTPRQLLTMAGHRLSSGYRRRLARFRYGPGVCKVDLALDGPVPWTAPELRRAGTVHIGGGLEEMAAGERDIWSGKHPERPFVLLAQPTLFDAGRAPAGKHTVWAYCHVPHGSSRDVSGAIEAQIERHAPGFRELIIGRHVRTAKEMEAYNPNYVGGDINGGVQDLRQLFTRPTLSLVPYATSEPALFLCSSSTPPGGGVHGLAGHHAALAALRRHG